MEVSVDKNYTLLVTCNELETIYYALKDALEYRKSDPLHTNEKQKTHDLYTTLKEIQDGGTGFY